MGITEGRGENERRVSIGRGFLFPPPRPTQPGSGWRAKGVSCSQQRGRGRGRILARAGCVLRARGRGRGRSRQGGVHWRLGGEVVAGLPQGCVPLQTWRRGTWVWGTRAPAQAGVCPPGCLGNTSLPLPLPLLGLMQGSWLCFPYRSQAWIGMEPPAPDYQVQFQAAVRVIQGLPKNSESGGRGGDVMLDTLCPVGFRRQPGTCLPQASMMPLSLLSAPRSIPPIGPCGRL